MQPSGGYPDLGAKAKLGTIGKLARGIMHDDGAVDLGKEALGRGGIAGDNGIGMMRGVARNMRQRGVKPVDHRNREYSIEILGIPIAGIGGLDPQINRAGPGIAAQLTLGIEQGFDGSEPRIEFRRHGALRNFGIESVDTT